MDHPTEVVFPADADGRRSTTALGRAVVAAAMQQIDPVGARAAAHETNWRRAYPLHFRRLLEAGLPSAVAARRIAAEGVTSLHQRMRVRLADGQEISPAEALSGAAPTVAPLSAVTVTGGGAPERELTVPYRGQRLRGDALARQLDTWVQRGTIEPSCAEAVRTVMANPDWLDTSDLQVVALGAGAEMGPVHSLLRWGGRVVAVDLPQPSLWGRLYELAKRYAGRMVVPVRGDGDLPEVAGVDLLHHLPQVGEWLTQLPGRLVVGNYAYADGGTHVRVATAADALAEVLLARRPDTALSFLATPTDVYAVPAEVVAHAERLYRQRRGWAQPVRWLSAGRLLQRNYPPQADPGIIDCLVPQQGPNYALAKRIQRWRATVARAAGHTVSLTVAPMTRTRSVVKNRALAAAYAGAHWFGAEVFEPATSNTLMAALLVHDLRHTSPPRAHPWQDEAAHAAHGGVWRVAYAPRSALGLAALMGVAGARH